ncbi:MAG TPA: Rieske 2Fe-2S domain-containing protein [Solirubrobacteraceae bacterium]|nr:Rieske 2Fe-2S domain-containing protein [Solirubrobacteraceae bacterium]
MDGVDPKRNGYHGRGSATPLSPRRGPRPRRSYSRPPVKAFALSGWALLPLRGFLGFTFCFAGLQKLANPNFFRSSDPAGIYAQMLAAIRVSPLHSVLSHLVRYSTPIGVLIALGELAVGLGVLAGLWTRVAAVGGVLLSLTLFLTVSFHSTPYYTGADIVFVFAWLPLVLAGSGGVLSLDATIAERARAVHSQGSIPPVTVPFSIVQRVCGHYEADRCQAMHGDPCDPGPCPYLHDARDEATVATQRRLGELTRREIVLGGAATAALGAAGLAAAGAAAGLGRAVGGTKPEASPVSLTPPRTPEHSTTTTVAPTGSGAATATTAAPPPGIAIGAAKDVPVGGSAHFTDPNTQSPSLVIQLKRNSFLAYDAVCPHAGCTVGYLASQQIIACPCHGSEFNPDNGDVIQGPAPRGLRRLEIAEGPNGDLYVAD